MLIILIFFIIVLGIILNRDDKEKIFSSTHHSTPITKNNVYYTPPLSDQFMSIEDKVAYLKSTKWKYIQYQVHKRDKCCQVCGSAISLDVHHITYKRLGNENIHTDLTLLCSDCHTALHQHLGYSRTTIYNI